MVRGLNKYTNSNFYSSTTIAQRGIYESTKESLKKNYPIVGNVNTKLLNEKYQFDSGHYIVITGYRYRIQGTPASKSVDICQQSFSNISPIKKR